MGTGAAHQYTTYRRRRHGNFPRKSPRGDAHADDITGTLAHGPADGFGDADHVQDGPVRVFEAHVDHTAVIGHAVELGMDRALHLIDELGCGKVGPDRYDCDAGEPKEGKTFKASLPRINAILGMEVPEQTARDILR